MNTSSRVFWRDAALVTTLFCISHAPAIVFPFTMWDDWSVLSPDRADVKRDFIAFGHAYSWPIVDALASVEQGPVRILAPLLLAQLYLGCFLLLYAICRACHTTYANALTITLIAVAAPFNFVKPITSAVAYSFTVPFALGGLLCVRRAMAERAWPMLTFGLAIGAVGVMTPSLAPVFVLAVILFTFDEALAQGRPVIGVARERAGMIALALAMPFAAVVARGFAFPVSDIVANYNRVTTAGLIDGVAGLPRLVALMLRDLRLFATIDPWFVLVAGSLAALILLPFIRRGLIAHVDQRWAMLGIGIALCVAAVFPYLAVGKDPRWWDWDHRQQLVLQFVIGFPVVAVLSLAGAKRFVPLIVVAGLAGVTAATWLDHHRDGHIQEATRLAFARSDAMLSARSIAVDDTMMFSRALGRRLRSIEWSGLARSAFGDDTRFVDALRPGENAAILERFTREPCGTVGRQRANFNYERWTPEGRLIVVRPVLSTVHLSGGFATTVSLTALALTNPPAYADRLASAVAIEMHGSFEVGSCTPKP